MSPRRVQTAVAGGLAFVAMFFLWAVAVAEEDYSLTSTEWNGLSEFLAMAEASGLEVLPTERLRWSDVDAADLVIVVYPTQELDRESLASFVIDGGRALVADDFGRSDPFLERLSLVREMPGPRGPDHESFVGQEPGWPIFTPAGRHPLLEDVDELVANFPAVLRNVGGPVVAYDDGGGFVYDMMLGKGRAVVIADPSILVNGMLPVADNRRFVENTLSYLCAEQDSCRVWLLVEEMDFIGHYGDSEDRWTGEDAARWVESLNEQLREAFLELPATGLIGFLAIFLVLGSAAYLATVVPWRRPRQISGFMGRRQREVSAPLTEFDWNVARFEEARGRINFALPMAVLKEIFEEQFLDALGLWPLSSGERPPVSEIARRFDERYGRGLPPEERRARREEVHRVLAQLAKIPSRDRVFLDSDGYYRRREFKRLYRRMERVMEWLARKEADERRTGVDDVGSRGA